MMPLSEISALRSSYDLVVVGAGPAGLAAATEAARYGGEVLLVDEEAGPGGQIYRALETTGPSRCAVLGPDYVAGRPLINAFRDSSASCLARTVVWLVTPAGKIGLSQDGRARLLSARRIILATGAMERPFPIAGWTLPGVMTAGAAQSLLKASGAVPDGRFVLAGTGPLLWLMAYQLLAAGAPPVAVLNTTDRRNILRAAHDLPGFLRSPYFRKGWRLMRKVRRAVPVVSGISELKAQGDAQITHVVYRQGNGERRNVEATSLLLHQGVIPNINLPASAGCEIEWDDAQACWKPVADDWGQSSVEAIAIAGDGAGIAGAEAAAARGRLCGLDAAHRLGWLDLAARNHAATEARGLLAHYSRGRAFLDHAFRPRRAFRIAGPDTLVCRCEEVTGRQIDEIVQQIPDIGPNQLKAFLRCGMGPCQGRLCGTTVTEMLSDRRGVPPAAVGYYRLRPPAKPITVGEIASLPQNEAALRAVVRG